MRIVKKNFTNKDLIIPFTMSKANGAQGGTYVPREDLLSKIEESFKSERIVFLSGMGGCGKSELAHIFSFLSDTDSLSRDSWTILRLFFLQSFQPLMLTISEGRRL